MQFVWIEPGTFMMGDAELGLSSHQVAISKGFYLGKYEITQGQWEAVMGTRPWPGEDYVQIPNLLGEDYVQTSPNHPAVHISWDDMQGFLHKLNQAAGDSLYRLPMEAEWEYACRAGTTTRWSFGDAENQLEDYAWYDHHSFWNVDVEYAHAVGTKLPNPWGLFDMHGNVWEWVQDRYGEYLGSSEADPTGPSTGSYRIIRGGCFGCRARLTRSANRSFDSPGNRYNIIGARLLRSK